MALIQNCKVFQPEIPQVVKKNHVVLENVGQTILHACFLCKTVVDAAVNDCVAHAPDNNIMLLFGQGSVSLAFLREIAEDVIHAAVHLADVAIVQDDLQVGVQNDGLVHVPLAGSRALVIDENNNILYTNFELKMPGKEKVHLLDIFDGRQQEIIQVVGEALENPTKVLRGSVLNKDVKCLVKAVQLPDDAGKNRIVLVLEPEK